MRFARGVFLLAGVQGIAVLAPMLFMEEKMSADYPPAITHAEFYYGFIGVALAWQIAFLIIAINPVRYRAIMLPGALEKLSYFAATAILFTQGRCPALPFVFGLVDLVLGVLFLVAMVRAGKS